MRLHGPTATLSVVALLLTTFAGAVPLEMGKPAPDFTLMDQNGKPQKLSAYRGRTVVLTFYPADMTPGCTLEARSLRDTMGEFQKRGAQVFGVSVQGVDSKKQFCDKEGLNYTLLADEGGKIAAKYGVLNPNGYAARVTYIVDPAGNVAQVVEQVDVQNHGKQVLALLDKMPAIRTGDFTLPDARTGKPVSFFGDGKQKASVLVFVSTTCPVSRAYESRIKELADSYASKGVRMIAVNANATESTSQIARHADETGFRFPVLHDEGNVIADRFKAQVTPEVFVFDAKGALRYTGRIDDSQDPSAVKSRDAKNALDAVLAGKTPPRTEARAFGCAIKRASR